MTITVVNEERNICATIKDVAELIISEVKKNGATEETKLYQYRLECDGNIVAISRSRTNLVDLFKQLSTKIVTDQHYCIIKSDNGKYSVVPYDANKL